MKKFWKRSVALMLACLMTAGSAATCASAKAEEAGENAEYAALAKQMELESVVLAQNNDQILPLSPKKEVAVFGNGQIMPSTGGSGSGAANGAYTSNFLDGVDKLGIEVYPELREYYEARVDQEKKTVNHGWDTAKEAPDEWGTPVYSGTGFSMTAGVATPEVKLDDGEVADDGLVARAADACDTAVVFLTRSTGSEEMDRIQQPGDWYLNHSEKVLLEQVSDKFEHIVVMMSLTGNIDMSWVEEYHVDSVMISYSGGSQNGYALAELAYGVANPSAKLPDTITETYEEHPFTENFGYVSYADKGMDFSKNNSAFGQQDPIAMYSEDVFEGFRYFDTFGKDVLYPFGSGLSYSDFAFRDMAVSADAGDKELTVNVTVENVTQDPDTVAGKEVAEVYVSAPEGDLEQPYQKLVDFEKTALLDSGDSEDMTFAIPFADFASYDEEQAAYVLEPGDYYIRVGGSSRGTHVAGCFRVEDEILVEQLSNELEMSEDSREAYEAEKLTTKNADPITYEGEMDELEAAQAQAVLVDASNVDAKTEAPVLDETVTEPLPEDAPVYRFDAVMEGEITLPQFVSQLTQDELVALCSGGATAGVELYYSDDPGIRIDNVGTKANQATSGAGQSRTIERFEIPSVIYADGSAGISYNENEELGIEKNIGWPRATSVACIWNKDLLREFGETVGKEMVDINVDIWLAPSINLHRNPLNGRNNEYYSEDPILSGKVASIVAEGVNASGVTVCLKHFAGNDNEWYRRGLQNETTLEKGTSMDAMNVISSERALREITLKPFEMAVKTGAVKNVMSAFNKLNGQYCAASEDLLLNILRGEWGFDGFVVTDWGDLDTIADPDIEMAGGNDVIMSGKHVMYRIPDKIVEGLEEKGTVAIEDLQRNAYHFLRTIEQMSLATMEDKHHDPGELEIRTTQLPIAKVNRAYSLSKVNPLIAAGGSGTSYTYSIDPASEAQLPNGMNLLPNGTITGMPEEGQQGTYQITFQAKDSDGNTASKTLPLTVEGELEVGPEQLDIARSGEDYAVQLTATDAEGNPVSNAAFTTDSPLPKGITLSADGLLSGASQETEPTEFPISVQVATPDGKNGAGHYTLHTIVKSVEVATEALTPAELNTVYKEPLQAEGGLTPYTWKVKDLPSGFALTEGQIRSGRLMFGLYFIPEEVPESAQGSYEVTLIVTDALGESNTRTVPFVVGDPDEQTFQIITGELEMGSANETYPTVQFKTANAQGEVRFSLDEASDPLPNGLELTADGKLEGTIASDASGIYQLVIRAEDGVSSTTKAYQLFVKGRLNADPAPFSVFQAKVGEPFSQTITAKDGPFSTDYTYKLGEKSDPLPEGLLLTVENDVAAIGGTPAEGTAGTYQLQIVMDTQTFAGNPVTSVVPYTLVVEGDAPVPTDRTALEQALKNAAGYRESSYTMASWAALEKAVQQAQSLPETASQEQVDAAAEAIEKAIAGLQRRKSSSGSHSTATPSGSNPYGADGTAVAGAAQAVTTQAKVTSDTTVDFSVKKGAAYCFKMTVVNGNGTAPSFTVGNGNVLKTQFVVQKGSDYYYRVYAVGAPGQSTGIYTVLPGQQPQKHCSITIAAN